MSSTESLPPTISVERAGELLGVSRRAAYRAVTKGQIPTVRIGRRLLVPTQRLLELLGMHAPEDTTWQVAPRFMIDDQELLLTQGSIRAHPIEPTRAQPADGRPRAAGEN
jgi:excisionase family DNA binding protein